MELTLASIFNQTKLYGLPSRRSWLVFKQVLMLDENCSLWSISLCLLSYWRDLTYDKLRLNIHVYFSRTSVLLCIHIFLHYVNQTLSYLTLFLVSELQKQILKEVDGLIWNLLRNRWITSLFQTCFKRKKNHKCYVHVIQRKIFNMLDGV